MTSKVKLAFTLSSLEGIPGKNFVFGNIFFCGPPAFVVDLSRQKYVVWTALV